MTTRLTHVIIFVSDMEESVRFFRDNVGLVLKYQSPFWSEFASGETTLALHPASETNPPGKVEIGLGVTQIQAFYDELSGKRGYIYPITCHGSRNAVSPVSRP